MHLDLPEPIAAYFAADTLDREAVAQCFTTDAVVKDEGHTHLGLAAIAQWKADASATYDYTCEPFHAQHKDGVTVVSCHLAGNFPGSPVDLRFFFRVERGKVAALEIRQ